VLNEPLFFAIPSATITLNCFSKTLVVFRFIYRAVKLHYESYVINDFLLSLIQFVRREPHH